MSDLFGVAGRVAVVTGASAGIGQHLALSFAEAGAHVIAVARRREALETLAAEHGAASIVADLAAIEDFGALAQALAEPFGAPDILINAAGVNHREPYGAITRATWDATLHLNLSVPFFLARSLVPAMADRGDGAIVNVASLQSVRAFPDSMAYGASKGGIVQLTRAMAEAWSGKGVRANAIAPGFFPTELTQRVFGDPERAARNAAQTAIGRNGDLDDLVGPTLFFCSPAARYVTGQVLFMDGGFTAK